MSLFQKLNNVRSATLANLSAQGLGAFGQLAALPIYLNYWGISEYGLWLLIVSVVSYASLLDLGVSQAAANQVIYTYSVGDLNQAIKWYFWTIRFTLFLVCFVFGFGLLLFNVFLDFNFALFKPLGGYANLILLALLAQVCLVVLSNLLMTLSRSLERNGIASWFGAIIQASEIIIPAWIVTVGFKMDVALISIVLARAFGTLALLTLTARARFSVLGKPPIHDGIKLPVRSILLPSVGNILFPLASIVYLQGSLLSVALQVNLSVSAAFGTTRTISRIPFQLGYVYTRANLVDLAISHAKKDNDKYRRILDRVEQIFVFLTFPLLILVVIFGTYALSKWTQGKLNISQSAIVLMALSVLFHSYWNICLVILTSKNIHANFSIVQCFLTVVSVFLMVLSGSLLWILTIIVFLEISLTFLGIFILNRKGIEIPLFSFFIRRK